MSGEKAVDMRIVRAIGYEDGRIAPICECGNLAFIVIVDLEARRVSLQCPHRRAHPAAPKAVCQFDLTAEWCAIVKEGKINIGKV